MLATGSAYFTLMVARLIIKKRVGLPLLLPAFSSFLAVPIPLTTSPKIVCFPSS
jgi:hypothetical protein